MKPSITIIVLDTMRLDEFQELEKKHQEFKKLGFTFLNNCIAPAPWTLPSHASLLTGKYPSEHGAHETREIKTLDIARIRLRERTLVTDLRELGYKTYGISANPYVHPIYGFDEFNKFIEESYFTDISGGVIKMPKRLRGLAAKYRNMYGEDIIKVPLSMLRENPNLIFEAPAVGILTAKSAFGKLRAKLVDGWPIEKGGKRITKTVNGMRFGKPFFLFINLMEAHDPYMGSRKDFNWATTFLKNGPNSKLIAQWKRLYSVGSLRAYRYAARIVSGLQERYGSNQLTIVTSDHGQAFNEHGFISHGTVLYDEVVKIPMAVKTPGVDRARISGYSSLVNVRDFLSEAINGNEHAIERLCSKAVYSESFGIPANISMVPGIDMAKLRAFDKPKRRKFS